MNTDILGRGFAFPLQTNPSGGILEARHEEKIRQSICMIIGTQHGERLMRPTFGCNLRTLVFAPNNTGTANLARHYVEEGLRRWEPRIILDVVSVQNDLQQDRLVIQVVYRIRATNQPQNLVYPFYLQPDTAE
jgi:phage baseplate assembly protein W